MARPSPEPPRPPAAPIGTAGARRRRPARSGRRRDDAARRRGPGPGRRRGAPPRRRRPTARRDTRSSRPRGDASVAFARRLSRICASRSGADLDLEVGRLAHEIDVVLVGDRSPHVDPLGDRRRRRRRAWRSEPSTRRSARASVRSPSTSRDSRCVSRRAPARSSRRIRADLGLEVLESEAQGRERRAQLVRRVGHERLLGVHELLEPAGHVVEGRADLPHLRRSRCPCPPGRARSPRPRRMAARADVDERADHPLATARRPAGRRRPGTASPRPARTSQYRWMRASTWLVE